MALTKILAGQVALLLALSFVAGATNPFKTNDVPAQPVDLVIHAPQEQTMFDAPFGQTGMSFMSDGGLNSDSSESSEVDFDVDMDMPNAPDVPPVGNQGSGYRVVGNLLPVLTGRKLPNTQDQRQPQLKRRSSSGQSVGIAFAVLGLIGVAMAGAMFAVRKYRQDMPFVRV